MKHLLINFVYHFPLGLEMAENKNTLKYVSLITLTVQNAVLALSMRHGRNRPGDRFISTTGNINNPLRSLPFEITILFLPVSAVFMAEIVKLVTCLVLVFLEEGKNAEKFVTALHRTIIKNPVDTIKICIPSLIYVIQNNLLYVSASHLDAATNQVGAIAIESRQDLNTLRFRSATS